MLQRTRDKDSAQSRTHLAYGTLLPLLLHTAAAMAAPINTHAEMAATTPMAQAAACKDLSALGRQIGAVHGDHPCI